MSSTVDQQDLEHREAAKTMLLLVTGSMQCGGAERVLSNMANYWARHGRQVTLATWDSCEVADFYPIEKEVTRVWLGNDLSTKTSFTRAISTCKRLIRFRRLIRSGNPDAVLSFIDTSNVMSLIAACGVNTRIVVSERNHPAHYQGISRFWRYLRKLTYRWANVVVVQTTDIAQWIDARCAVSSVVIPNPLRAMPDYSNERQPIVLAIGRLSRQKGFDILLRAFARIADEHPHWKLIVAGGGPEKESILKLCEDLKLTTRVEVMGPVDDVAPLMSRAGVFVQPSRYEGFPNVLLEAMAMGAAVVSADCPSGPADIIDDGVNGRLVPAENVGALSQVMNELMSNEKLRLELGEQALSVRSSYKQSKIMPRWERCVLPEANNAH